MMLVRLYIYLHVLAVALTGLAAYWDRVGNSSQAPAPLLYLGILSTYLLPVLPIVCLILVGAVITDRRDRLFAFVVGCLATSAHIIAGLPLVQ